MEKTLLVLTLKLYVDHIVIVHHFEPHSRSSYLGLESIVKTGVLDKNMLVNGHALWGSLSLLTSNVVLCDSISHLFITIEPFLGDDISHHID